jgi:hypothetical protein
MGHQGVIIKVKDGVIVNWVLNMQKVSLSFTLQQLKLKVAEVTQTRLMPFQNGVSGNG